MMTPSALIVSEIGFTLKTADFSSPEKVAPTDTGSSFAHINAPYIFYIEYVAPIAPPDDPTIAFI